MATESAVLYHDAQLYARDLKLFTSNAWLNDAAINFYLTVVFHEVCGAPSDVLLMDPAVVSCMMLQCDDEEDLTELAQGLQLKEKSLIVLPVNDRTSFDTQGSHWALLVYSTDHGFQFYDSSADHNLESAHEVAGVLGRALGLPPSAVAVRTVQCPQQRNAYDCGMYVCMIAEWVCTSHCKVQSLGLDAFVTPETIQSKRRSMPSLVAQLQRK